MVLRKRPYIVGQKKGKPSMYHLHSCYSFVVISDHLWHPSHLASIWALLYITLWAVQMLMGVISSSGLEQSVTCSGQRGPGRLKGKSPPASSILGFSSGSQGSHFLHTLLAPILPLEISPCPQGSPSPLLPLSCAYLHCLYRGGGGGRQGRIDLPAQPLLPLLLG